LPIAMPMKNQMRGCKITSETIQMYGRSNTFNPYTSIYLTIWDAFT